MDILSILKTVAPWIGTAIGGPLGGIAVDVACNVFGLKEKTVESLKKAISGATPEQMLMLKNADQEFALKMQELGFAQVKDLEGIAAEDRKDARNLLSNIRSWVPAILSIIVTGGFFAVLAGMTFWGLDIKDNTALLVLLGNLGTGWMSVLAFWFGTTSGSAQKTEMLARSTPIDK